jgi:CheY-like chemotaxis protein
MEYDLEGSAAVEYLPTGLQAELVIPESHLVASADMAPTQAIAVPNTSAVLHGLDVLLVEDQALIAMDTEDTLRKLGAAKVRLAANVARSIIEIEGARPDFAILDFNLGNETSTEIAETLRSLKVPFLFVTGYGDNVVIPEHLKQVPIVRKPVSATSLAARIEEVSAAQ